MSLCSTILDAGTRLAIRNSLDASRLPKPGIRDCSTAKLQSSPPTLELPCIVHADGGLRCGRRRNEHSVCHSLGPAQKSLGCNLHRALPRLTYLAHSDIHLSLTMYNKGGSRVKH